jgi:hypothetical protein
MREAFGVDPLDQKQLSQHGIEPKGALIAMRVKIGQVNAFVVAVTINSSRRFDGLLRKVAAERLLASHLQTTTTDGMTITTAYRKRPDGHISEEFAYTLRHGIAVIALDSSQMQRTAERLEVKQTSSDPKFTQHAANVIRAINSIKSTDSLLADQRFQSYLQQHKTQSQIILHIPPAITPQVSAVTKSKHIATRPSDLYALAPRKLAAPAQMLPILSALQHANPFTEGISAVSFGSFGVKIHSALPITESLGRNIRAYAPEGGDPEKLFAFLHKHAIASLKLSLNPPQIHPTLEQFLPSSISAQQIYELLRQHTSLDMQKDIIPALTGHALVALYHVHSRIYRRMYDPMLLPQFLEFAIVAELKDPKLAHATLQKLAENLEIAGRKTRRIIHSDGQIQYWIPSWPGTVAHWTIVDRFFIYSLSPRPLKLSLDALHNPNKRTHTQTSPLSSHLRHIGNWSVHLDLKNLLQAINALDIPFSLKLIINNAFLMIKNIQAIQFTYQHTQQQIELQLKVQLQQSKSENSGSSSNTKHKEISP